MINKTDLILKSSINDSCNKNNKNKNSKKKNNKITFNLNKIDNKILLNENNIYRNTNNINIESIKLNSDINCLDNIIIKSSNKNCLKIKSNKNLMFKKSTNNLAKYSLNKNTISALTSNKEIIKQETLKIKNSDKKNNNNNNKNKSNNKVINSKNIKISDDNIKENINKSIRNNSSSKSSLSSNTSLLSDNKNIKINNNKNLIEKELNFNEEQTVIDNIIKVLSRKNENKRLFSKFFNKFKFSSNNTKQQLTEHEISNIMKYIHFLPDFINKVKDKNDVYYYELLRNISINLKYEFAKKDQILYKYGDLGEKCYIVLLGKCNVYTPVEEKISMSEIDFISYLCTLRELEEYELLNLTLKANYKYYQLDIKYFDIWIEDIIEKNIKYFEEHEIAVLNNIKSLFMCKNEKTKNKKKYLLSLNRIQDNYKSYVDTNKYIYKKNLNTKSYYYNIHDLYLTNENDIIFNNSSLHKFKKKITISSNTNAINYSDLRLEYTPLFPDSSKECLEITSYLSNKIRCNLYHIEKDDQYNENNEYLDKINKFSKALKEINNNKKLDFLVENLSNLHPDLEIMHKKSRRNKNTIQQNLKSDTYYELLKTNDNGFNFNKDFENIQNKNEATSLNIEKRRRSLISQLNNSGYIKDDNNYTNILQKIKGNIKVNNNNIDYNVENNYLNKETLYDRKVSFRKYMSNDFNNKSSNSNSSNSSNNSNSSESNLKIRDVIDKINKNSLDDSVHNEESNKLLHSLENRKKSSISKRRSSVIVLNTENKHRSSIKSLLPNKVANNLKAYSNFALNKRNELSSEKRNSLIISSLVKRNSTVNDFNNKELKDNNKKETTLKKHLKKLFKSKDIKKNTNNFTNDKDNSSKVLDDIRLYTIYYYKEQNNIYRKNQIFGRQALESKNSKSNATIICSEDTHLGIIDKCIYKQFLSDINIRFKNQITTRILSNELFLQVSFKKFSKYFHSCFKQFKFYKGEKVLMQFEKIKGIFLTKEGSFEVSFKGNLKDINSIIECLSKYTFNHSKFKEKLSDLNEEENLLIQKKHNFKLAVYTDKILTNNKFSNKLESNNNYNNKNFSNCDTIINLNKKKTYNNFLCLDNTNNKNVLNEIFGIFDFNYIRKKDYNEIEELYNKLINMNDQKENINLDYMDILKEKDLYKKSSSMFDIEVTSSTAVLFYIPVEYFIDMINKEKKIYENYKRLKHIRQEVMLSRIKKIQEFLRNLIKEKLSKNININNNNNLINRRVSTHNSSNPKFYNQNILNYDCKFSNIKNNKVYPINEDINRFDTNNIISFKKKENQNKASDNNILNNLFNKNTENTFYPSNMHLNKEYKCSNYFKNTIYNNKLNLFNNNLNDKLNKNLNNFISSHISKKKFINNNGKPFNKNINIAKNTIYKKSKIYANNSNFNTLYTERVSPIKDNNLKHNSINIKFKYDKFIYDRIFKDYYYNKEFNYNKSKLNTITSTNSNITNTSNNIDSKLMKTIDKSYIDFNKYSKNRIVDFLAYDNFNLIYKSAINSMKAKNKIFSNFKCRNSSKFKILNKNSIINNSRSKFSITNNNKNISKTETIETTSNNKLSFNLKNDINKFLLYNTNANRNYCYKLDKIINNRNKKAENLCFSISNKEHKYYSITNFETK